jgi:hypothetical protein
MASPRWQDRNNLFVEVKLLDGVTACASGLACLTFSLPHLYKTEAWFEMKPVLNVTWRLQRPWIVKQPGFGISLVSKSTY